MVTNRLSREFGDEVQRLMGTRRGMVSAVGVDLQVLLALQTSREAVDKAGEYILRRPVRVASVLSSTPDPLLLAALAGDRSMRNLAGLDATGTDGQDLDYTTSLETMAARAARDHVIRCQRDPVAARELEAAWVANRSAIRSSFLRESVEAIEATYGTACGALLDAAEGRRPLVAPPPTWAAQGVMASVARPFPQGFQQSFGNVLMTTAPPEKWMPRQGRGYEGWDRVRTRFIAKGGIGRAEQLARRSRIRVPASRMMMRSRLTANLARGPEAAKHFVQRAASHPRRAAALLSMQIDPMVIAAALGPQAMAAVLQGQRVPMENQAARLCDALVRADRDRVSAAMAAGDPDKAMAELRQAGDLGEVSHSFVEKAWSRSVPPVSDPRSTPLGLPRYENVNLDATWQKARAGNMSPADISPALRAQIEAAAADAPADIDLTAWDDFDDGREAQPDIVPPVPHPVPEPSMDGGPNEDAPPRPDGLGISCDDVFRQAQGEELLEDRFPPEHFSPPGNREFLSGALALFMDSNPAYLTDVAGDVRNRIERRLVVALATERLAERLGVESEPPAVPVSKDPYVRAHPDASEVMDRLGRVADAMAKEQYDLTVAYVQDHMKRGETGPEPVVDRSEPLPVPQAQDSRFVGLNVTAVDVLAADSVNPVAVREADGLSQGVRNANTLAWATAAVVQGEELAGRAPDMADTDLEHDGLVNRQIVEVLVVERLAAKLGLEYEAPPAFQDVSLDRVADPALALRLSDIADGIAADYADKTLEYVQGRDSQEHVVPEPVRAAEPTPEAGDRLDPPDGGPVDLTPDVEKPQDEMFAGPKPVPDPGYPGTAVCLSGRCRLK